MRTYAILIDGGFLKRKVGTADDPASVAKIDDFARRLCSHEKLASHTLHRIYYYDAQPYKDSRDVPLQGGTINFGESEVAQRNRKLLQGLTKLPYFAVRLGETVFRGWQVKHRRLMGRAPRIEVTAEDLAPVIGQKGVDMRIALDIASLTLKRIVDIIVLVTGDSDFVPAMKFARREGCQLYLVTLRHGIRDPLEEHADLLLDIAPAIAAPAGVSVTPVAVPTAPPANGGTSGAAVAEDERPA